MSESKTLAYLTRIDLQNAVQIANVAEVHEAALFGSLQKELQKLRDSGADVNDFEKLLNEAKALSQKAQEEEKKNEALALQEDADAHFHSLITAYLKTKNPLFLWEIYSICRLINRKLPDFVLEYFDQCANNLLSYVSDIPLENTITRKAERSNEYSGEDCLKALGLYRKNQTKAFAGMRQYQAKYYLIFDIERQEVENLANGMEPNEARSDAIKTIHIAQDKAFPDKPISEGALRKFYLEYKKNGSSLKD